MGMAGVSAISPLVALPAINRVLDNARETMDHSTTATWLSAFAQAGFSTVGPNKLEKFDRNVILQKGFGLKLFAVLGGIILLILFVGIIVVAIGSFRNS